MGNRLYGLDALRGIAALIVLWHHMQSNYGFQIVHFAAVSAVDLFLVLSGFVMARSYEPNLPRHFIWLRYRRLFPTMAIGTSLGLLLAIVRSGVSFPLLSAFAANLLFLPWPYMGLFAINFPAWSLYAEIIANMLHRIAFSRLGTKTLGVLISLSAVIFAVATFATGEVAWGSDGASLAVATVRCLCCYLIGIVVWRVFGDRPILSPSIALAGLPVLLMIGAYSNGPLFSVTFALFGAPLLLRAGLGLGRSRLATLAGEASFPLYAVHFPIIAASVHFGGSAALAFCLCLMLAVALCRSPVAGSRFWLGKTLRGFLTRTVQT